MPIPDPRAGNLLIWLVSCLLFLSVIAGGGLLLLYMLEPETETTSWFPIAGVALVCLPWSFWLLTCLYRLISRCFGVRIAAFSGGNGGGGGDGGGGGGGGGNINLGNNKSDGVVNESNAGDSQDGKHVRFGTAMVVNEQNGGSSHNGRIGSLRSSSSDSNNDHSYRSHESELPLAQSMAH